MLFINSLRTKATALLSALLVFAHPVIAKEASQDECDPNSVGHRVPIASDVEEKGTDLHTSTGRCRLSEQTFMDWIAMTKESVASELMVQLNFCLSDKGDFT